MNQNITSAIEILDEELKKEGYAFMITIGVKVEEIGKVDLSQIVYLSMKGLPNNIGIDILKRTIAILEKDV